MSKLLYKYQSVADLEYKLYISSDLKPNFNILKNKVINWQGIVLDFSIIGASHFVKINYGNPVHITELVACVKSEDIVTKNIFQEKKLVNHHQYNYTWKINELFNYIFSTEIINDCVQTYQEFKKKYLFNHQDSHFDYIFPSKKGLALTSIDVCQETDKLSWITYHSYPDEHKIIKTCSLLERSE